MSRPVIYGTHNAWHMDQKGASVTVMTFLPHDSWAEITEHPPHPALPDPESRVGWCGSREM